LNRRRAPIAYGTCYVPALLYSLTAMSLNRKQIDNIQQKATTEYIQKIGYDMHFPRKVVYGSIKFGGLGITQLYVDSCCTKIQSLLCNINANTMLGEMMRINLIWTQLLSGLSIPILESNSSIQYISNNWYIQLQQFTMYIGAQIRISGCWTPTMKRKHDFSLMDRVNQLDISKNKKQIFNNWRIFFQVDSVSDVVNASGNKIINLFLNKKLAYQYTSPSVLRWPIQGMHGTKTFAIRSSILKKITKSTKSGNLHNNIGAWIVTPTSYRNYKALVHYKLQHILVKEEQIWWIIKLSHKVQTIIYYANSTKRKLRPSDIRGQHIPVDFNMNKLFYYINAEHYQHSIQDNINSSVTINKERDLQKIF
jgi:hypothetical protein